MGLFGKKDPCAICGGKVTGLLPWKVEGQLVCKACYGHVDLPDGVANNMTMEAFKAYRAFREENAQLKGQFQTTQQVSFGFFGDQFVFDTNNRLFCRDVNLDGTIFEGKNIKSFTIREDGAPLFEGSAAGLVCYTSTVPDRIIAMTPMIQQVAMMMELKRQADRVADDKVRSTYYRDIPEPFRQFVVEIHCEHPYWKTIRSEKKGPEFNNSYPDANEYLRDYQEGAEIMGQLARALMEVAFPGAPEQRAGSGAVSMAGQSVAAPAASADVVAEIQRFKALVDQGILTEEEFAAKKRQLLGI